MASVTICIDFGAPQNKSVAVSVASPSIYHEIMWSDTMILGFWILSFKPTFSLSSFTFIKRLFNSSLSAIRVVSSAYLRLLIFLLAIFIPACASPSPVFRLTIYSLDVLLFLFGTGLSFHVQFYLLSPNLYTDFSVGRSGGLVFTSLSEFSTVYCDPHSPRLWHSQ